MRTNAVIGGAAAKLRSKRSPTVVALIILVCGIAYYAPYGAKIESVESAAEANPTQPNLTQSRVANEARPHSESADAASTGGIGEDYPPLGSDLGPAAFDPAQLYAKYLGAANSGDLDAQYVLVTALNECRHGPTTLDEIVELERSGVPQDVIRSVRDRFERCHALYVAVPDLEKEYEERYSAARAAGHPLILVKQRHLPVNEKIGLVIQAISRDYPEPYLLADAYLEAASLYRDYPEKLDVIREEAWTLLYCKASFHCDSAQELTFLRTKKYHAHEIDAILTTYTSITNAIRRKDWGALGL